MAYSFDERDQSLVVNGWENGISPDPYEGTSNLQNVNISSVPGEASVGFSTIPLLQTSSYQGITVTAYGDGGDVYCLDSLVPKLENGQAIYFATGGTITGINATTVYYVYGAAHHSGGNCTFGVSTIYGAPSGIIIGTTGTATMYTFDPNFQSRGNISKNYMVQTATGRYHWALDSNGLVWSDLALTYATSGITTTNSWTYTGNFANTTGFGSRQLDAYGNGMTYLQTADNSSPGALDGWIFIWRNGEIDYVETEIAGVARTAGQISWVYGWDPGYVNPGHTGESTYLFNTTLVSHEALVTPDGRLSYCDGYKIARFYQTDTVTPTNFDPTNTATYTFNRYPLLPPNDIAQTLQYLSTGSPVYIGGNRNVLYPWDTISTQPTTPGLILLPESNIVNLITVGQLMYIFCGNRGNIYLTNGSQASFWNKVPDHLSGTVQPTYVWGGATYIMNKLYFGISGTLNGTSTAVSGYGGIWEANLVTKSLCVSNILTGLSTAMPTSLLAMNTSVNAGNSFSGYGVYATYEGSSIGAIEGPSNVPYTNGTSVIETEIIPIGTYNDPRNFEQIEYRLVRPMVSGDSITVNYRPNFASPYALIFTDSTTGNFSNTKPNTMINSQWVQFQIILTSSGTTTSYVRLKEIRLLGMIGPSLQQAEELTL